MFVSQNFVNSSLKSTFCNSIYSKVNPCFSIFILVRFSDLTYGQRDTGTTQALHH